MFSSWTRFTSEDIIANLSLFRRDAVYSKAAFHVIDEPEILSSPLDCDDIYSNNDNVATITTVVSK